VIAASLILYGCGGGLPVQTEDQTFPYVPTPNPNFSATPLPTRPTFKPGELVDYIAQTGDTLPALAARFNTSVDEILAANPIIPRDATTMPPGLPMKIPIYFRALWANPFQILPDHAFVNGPTVIGFNTSAFVADHPGWLKDYKVYAGGQWRTGAKMVDYIATNYSISPRLLLAILEYQGGALTQPEPPVKKNLLGLKRLYYESPYLQLVIAANILNNGYYGWRAGDLLEFELPDGTLIRPDPWQNAASVGLQYYFSKMLSGQAYARAIGPQGIYETYVTLFGDPWQDNFVLIPGSLRQPEMFLPIPRGLTWTYTGGPHTGWGSGEPLASLDFAPPSDKSGCFIPDDNQYATAMADGLIVRSGIDGVVQDLDGDGDERTGWVIFYLHLAARERAPLGAMLHAGDKIGYPSCEGGRVTGTHVHIGRKYNGEWILADGPLGFNLEGWLAHNGSQPYQGTLTKGELTVKACECSDLYSAIQAGP
jgi:murein DD-endopeptidase MepM/ murein hydrolase activator NlpD